MFFSTDKNKEPIVLNKDFQNEKYRTQKAGFIDSIKSRRPLRPERVDKNIIYIALTGVDSRIGERYKHADANHILAINPPKKHITIYSVPRDTETEYEMNDTTIYKIAEVRAKGRKIYLEELCRIAAVPKIDHYAEFGFSQAQGFLEWFGYDDAGSTLQVLRSRKVIKGDDFQRHYNQANFIKQMLVANFDKLNGLLGDAIIAGGISIVDTDISFAKGKYLHEQLFNSGFPKKYAFSIKVVPDTKIKFNDIDFSNTDTLRQMVEKIEHSVSKKADSLQQGNVQKQIVNTLEKALNKARSDSSKSPLMVINDLRVLYDQRAWLQISNIKIRDYYREHISSLLVDAYFKKGQTKNAERVINNIENEKKFFERSESKKLFMDSLNRSNYLRNKNPNK